MRFCKHQPAGRRRALTSVKECTCNCEREEERSGRQAMSRVAQVGIGLGTALLSLVCLACLVFAMGRRRRKREREESERRGSTELAQIDKDEEADLTRTHNLLHGTGVVRGAGAGAGEARTLGRRSSAMSQNPLFMTRGGAESNADFLGNDSRHALTNRPGASTSTYVSNPLAQLPGDAGEDAEGQTFSTGIFFSSDGKGDEENAGTDAEASAEILPWQESDGQEAVAQGREDLALLEAALADLATDTQNANVLEHVQSEIAAARNAFAEAAEALVEVESMGTLVGGKQRRVSTGPDGEPEDFAAVLRRARRRLQKVQESAAAASANLKFSDRQRLLGDINKVRRGLRRTPNSTFRAAADAAASVRRMRHASSGAGGS